MTNVSPSKQFSAPCGWRQSFSGKNQPHKNEKGSNECCSSRTVQNSVQTWQKDAVEWAAQNNVQTLQKNTNAHYKRMMFEWGRTLFEWGRTNVYNFTKECCCTLHKNAVWAGQYKTTYNFTKERWCTLQKHTVWVGSTKQHANFTKERCCMLQKNAVCVPRAVQNNIQTTKERCCMLKKHTVLVGQYKTTYKLYNRMLLEWVVAVIIGF